MQMQSSIQKVTKLRIHSKIAKTPAERSRAYRKRKKTLRNATNQQLMIDETHSHVDAIVALEEVSQEAINVETSTGQQSGVWSTHQDFTNNNSVDDSANNIQTADLCVPYKVILQMERNSKYYKEDKIRSYVAAYTPTPFQENKNLFGHAFDTVPNQHSVPFVKIETDEYQISENSIITAYLNNPDDNSLKNLLELWNLGHVYEYFKSERISIDVLKFINDEEIKELIQNLKIGDRVIFRHYFQKWRETFNNPQNITDKPNKVVCTTAPYSPKSFYETENLELKSVNMSLILKQNRKAKIIDDFYKEKQKLDEEHRNMLISIIINFFEANNLNMSLHTSYQLEKEILQIFPTEKLDFYRTEKRGKIYTRAAYLKQSLKSIVKSSTSSQSSNQSLQKETTTFVPESDALQNVQRLKEENLSEEEFDNVWLACSNYRLNQIQNHCKNFSDVLQNWPEYKKPSGYRLIDKDFGILFKDYDGFVEGWKTGIYKIYKFLTNEKNLKDPFSKMIIQSILDVEIENGDVSYVFRTLYCLHGYLYPTSKVIKSGSSGKKDITRYTMRDSQDSFIYVGQSLHQLEDHIEFLKNRDENIQPFILAIADQNYKQFDEFFIYMDGNKIPISNLITSVDICFKIFHLFNLEYPKPCSVFWTFIENYFYKFTKASKKSSKICILIEELQNIC